MLTAIIPFWYAKSCDDEKQEANDSAQLRFGTRCAFLRCMNATAKDRKMKKVTFTNDFHRTESTCNLRDGQTVLTRNQMRRLNKNLCGMPDCNCGVVRGRQDNPDFEYTLDRDLDGEFETIELID